MTPLDVALDLAARGAFVFPCSSKGKNRKGPAGFFKWSVQSTREPDEIRAFWQRFPDALVAIDCGKSGFLVVDPDRHGPADGVLEWMKMCEDHGWSDHHCPRVSTASGGEHIYFRNINPPIGCPKLIKGLIDVKGEGGYVIAPGSQLTDDPGNWVMKAGDIFQALEPPQWLVDRLRTVKEREVEARPIYEPRAQSSDARIEAYVSGALAKEYEEVARTFVGGRNNALNASAFNLGQLVGGSLLMERDVRATLMDAASANGLVKDDGVQSVLRTITSGIRAGIQKPRGLPEQEASREVIVFSQPRQVIASGNDLIDAETGEVVEEARPAMPVDDLWRRPGGLIREIAEWVMATSPRPNWPLAIASATALMSTLCSRHLCGPTRSGTHLFIACIGDTAIGKDRPLKAPLAVLKAMEMVTMPGSFTRVFTTGKFKSETAIEEVVRDVPARLAKIDELGQLFARMGSRRASSHEAGMASLLRELWSQEPGGVYQTSSRAGSSSMMLEMPALSILGAATTQEFYASIAGASVENGLLNRWLIVQADPRGADQDTTSDPWDFPRAMADRLAALMPAQTGNLPNAGAGVLTLPQRVEPHIMPWASDTVREAYKAMDRELLARLDEDQEIEPFIGRTAEMALRLATIHAAGRGGRHASITIEDWNWGRSLAMASASIMSTEVRDRMAENQHQADYKLIYRIVKNGGASGIKHRALYNAVNGRVRGQDMEVIMKQLINAGRVEAIQHPEDKPSRGPWPARYLAK